MHCLPLKISRLWRVLSTLNHVVRSSTLLLNRHAKPPSRTGVSCDGGQGLNRLQHAALSPVADGGSNRLG